MPERTTGRAPSVVAELVERLTTLLGTPFTLTDDLGSVLASTAGRRLGNVESGALAVLREGRELESAGGSTRGDGAGDDPAVPDPDAAMTGPAVYLPVSVAGRPGGVLIAHGRPAQVGAVARTAAAAASLLLEIARSASSSLRQSYAPDLVLYRLLRAHPAKARQAAQIARVLGWELGAPRVALVVIAAEPHGGALESAHYDMIGKFVHTVVPGTPFGRLDAAEWVLLPEPAGTSGGFPPRRLAEDIREALIQTGVEAVVGVGEEQGETSPSGLRRSYREGVYAARCGQRLRGPGVYRLRDLGPAAFLAPSRTTRRRLAEGMVRPLRDQPEALATLHAFLASDLSLTATAHDTGLHRHTIRNHLERVRKLTGLDARCLDQAIQLRLALLLTSSGRPSGAS